MYATLLKPRILVPSYHRSLNLACLQVSKYLENLTLVTFHSSRHLTIIKNASRSSGRNAYQATEPKTSVHLTMDYVRLSFLSFIVL